MKRRHLLPLVSPLLFAACAADFDTTRVTSDPKTTLGEDMFTVLCDRVGASAFEEDLEGRSFHGVCHKSQTGWKISKVDASALPAVTPGTPVADARRLSVAKVEAMARHRADLIQAFDTIFPDDQIPDPFHPTDSSRKVRLHDALTELTHRLTPLYETNPFATSPSDPALLPSSTESLARFFDAFVKSPSAQTALAGMGSRQGYRPLPVTLGALRAFLAYPRLRQLSKVLLDRTGPGGTMEAQLQHFLQVAQHELAALTPDPDVGPVLVDAAHVAPNRPRQKLEILAALFLAENPVYNRTAASPHPIARRDDRGYVVPRGWSPGAVTNFRTDASGYLAHDALGAFLDGNGQPVPTPPPFLTPDLAAPAGVSFDPLTQQALSGGQPIFDYLDTSQTFAGSMLYDFQPLVSPPTSGPSTLMKALEGAYFLYGDKAASDPSGYPIPYQAFLPDTSPLLDLTYATGQLLGARGSDDYLGSILELHQSHPDKTGRALALAWSIWNKSKDPAYASAVLADTSTFWDDMADWIAKIARVGVDHYTAGSVNPAPRGLLADMTLALATPAAQTWLPLAYAPAMKNKDRLTYDPTAINGAPGNRETGQPLSPMGGPALPVDRTAPDQGDNRSAFQRFAHVIAAAAKVKSCNKMGSLVKSNLDICGLTIPLTYPINLDPCCTQLTEPACNLLGISCKVPSIGECGLFEIDDLGVFFLDSSLAADHPRRAHLKIKDATLTGLLGLVGSLVPKTCNVDIDHVLEGSTGIQGLTTVPTPQALARLVFFGADSEAFGSSLPDSDPEKNTTNAGLNTFLSNTMDPVGTGGCPPDGLGVNTCAQFGDTLRGMGQDTFFVSETPWLPQHPADCTGPECSLPSSGFYEGMRPVLTTFANYSYDPDPGEICQHLDSDPTRCAGEQLFLDLVTILDRHWSSGSSALVHYEDFLAWVFSQSDLFGTMGDLGPTLRDQSYVSPRVLPGQTRSGLDVTTELLSFLFDQQLAATNAIRSRKGEATGIRNDGMLKPQVTPYDLFVQALRGMDRRFDAAGALGVPKKAAWRSARSELVDQFLLADDGQWKNPAIAAALPLLGRITREQVNAHCPDRETTGHCAWARTDLANELGDVLGGPLFAAINDLQEALRGDDVSRVELENLLVYLLELTKDPDTLLSTLTSFADLLQVLHDDGRLAPVLNAAAESADPGTVTTFDKQGVARTTANPKPGIGDTTIQLMKLLLDDHAGDPAAESLTVDRYHVMDRVLPNLVTAPAPGKPTPLEVIIDTISDVHRVDSSAETTLSADDYRAVFGGMKSFLVDPYRGLEQFYTIIKHRDE